MEEIDKKSSTISKSKYEMTLAEFPLFLLKGDSRNIECIKYEDTITGDKRLFVKREWKVYPDSKLGFGTASTLSTFFELFQIWKEDNFNQQSIYFGSIYNLTKRKGLQPNKRTYERIRRDLSCLVGMKIEAKNAFWDNERKAYVDMIFHLFESVFFFKEKPDGPYTLPFGQIKSSDILYGSILKNSLLIAGFDSKFFHSLTPLEQRLALYLSKVFRSQTVHKREIQQFAQQIPVYAKQTKHTKEQLKEASKGLIAKGFTLLESCDFERGNDRKELIVFKRRGSVPLLSFEKKPKPDLKKEQYEIDALVEDILNVCQDRKSIKFYKKVAQLLPADTIYRALSEVKEVRDLGEIKKTKGALFTSLVKKYANDLGIDL